MSITAITAKALENNVSSKEWANIAVITTGIKETKKKGNKKNGKRPRR